MNKIKKKVAPTGIHATPQYQRWKRIVDSAAIFPIEKHYEEARGLHESRKSGSLYNHRIRAQNLIDASAQDTGVRSRLVFLLIQAKRNIHALEQANNAMINWILGNQHAKGSTVAERKNWAENVVVKGTNLEGDLDNFIEVLGIIIADIDAAGWNVKRIVDALNLTSKAEQSL